MDGTHIQQKTAFISAGTTLTSHEQCMLEKTDAPDHQNGIKVVTKWLMNLEPPVLETFRPDRSPKAPIACMAWRRGDSWCVIDPCLLTALNHLHERASSARKAYNSIGGISFDVLFGQFGSS